MSSPASRDATHFDRIAPDYHALRPADAGWWQVFDAIVRAGDLRGRRVLEVGCGTGRLAEALAERAFARVWAVDASAEMAAEARRRGVTVRVAPAERLPFRDGWFDRGVLRMVVHLLDRPAAFAELRRVLRADGRVVVATIDPAAFGEHWLAPFFPSLPRIDAARFPSAERLQADLEDAGFAVTLERLVHDASVTRAEALARIRGRAFSTFELLSENELREGVARAESELPERLEYARAWVVASAKGSM